ncbi:hypothetical protein V3851_23580 [Paenibacillus sp. M1]|uniref:Uncharacterized protein n=1 Tax=Paenibacillus haidiansis TaxID=1574488 RepID=A0ABU7VYD4_9BACL|nr:hypothetical protein [Paenibacillus oralis]
MESQKPEHLYEGDANVECNTARSKIGQYLFAELSNGLSVGQFQQIFLIFLYIACPHKNKNGVLIKR